MEKPKPKQETLEEDSESYKLAKNLFTEIYGYNSEIIEGNQQHELIVAALQKGMVYGAKRQQEQDKNKYSVEEVLEHLNLLYSMKNSMVDTFTNDDDYITMKWFEQFKKK
jgi:hypothetical protein